MIVQASGDLGDCVASLAVCRNLYNQIGEKIILNAVDWSGLREPFIPRVPLISRLIESQPYIERLEIGAQIKPDIDLVRFRPYHSRFRTLLWAQTQFANTQLKQPIPYETSPWIQSERSSYSPGRIIIARSHRYRNDLFAWTKIIDRFRDRCLFLGSKSEHADVEARFGWVEWVPTKDLYEAASLVAGGDCFIGNQSSLLNIALGLGQNVVCELNTFVADVVIARGNATYCYDGNFTFEGETFTSSFPIPDNHRDLVCQKAILNSILKF